MNAITMLQTCGARQFEQEGALARDLMSTVSGEPTVYTGAEPFFPEEPMGHPEAVPLGTDAEACVP